MLGMMAARRFRKNAGERQTCTYVAQHELFLQGAVMCALKFRLSQSFAVVVWRYMRGERDSCF